MKKNYEKKIVPVLLGLVLLIFLSPIKSYASGLNYDLTKTDNMHWGSDPYTTSYPNLLFTIHQTTGGMCWYRIERLSGGSWIPESTGDNGEVALNGDKQVTTIKVPIINSSTQYRVFAHTSTWLEEYLSGYPSYATGYVSATGSW